ncbi:MAG: FAD-dependent oxidoreductase [Desulfurococcales archaeon]|nr:FAD-dependent oxidoreductase [Desulfurococcales archaeon]
MRIVVIGGGAAGMAAASRAKRLRKEAEVVVVEKTDWISFALCGMPYYIGCIVKRLEDLLHYPVEEFTKKRGIDVRLRNEALDIDASSRTVRVQDEKGKEYELEWDYLVLALGAKSVASNVFPEIKELENVHYLSHLYDAYKIREKLLRLRRGSTINIVGAGYVGLELAHTVTELGYRVRVLEMADQVLPRSLDKDMADIVSNYLASKGVELVLGEKTIGFTEKDGNVVVETEGNSYESKLAIVGVGIKPNTDLAIKAGVETGVTGAIKVDERMETSISNVYAVGDAVETINLVTGKPAWMPFAQIANKMGYVAGTNIGGRQAVFPGATGTSTLEVFDLTIARTGLTEAEARNEGYNVITAKVTARTKPHYMSGSRQISLKVIADADTGKLLGAQGVGEDQSVFWRVNVIAALLERQSTVWDLFYSDIGYAPPLAPVWDSLIIAARLLMRKLGEVPKKA